MIVRTIKEWKKLAKSGGVHNPLMMVGKYADFLVYEGGYGNGFRRDKAWTIYTPSERTPSDALPDVPLAIVNVNGIPAWFPVPPEEGQRPCSESVYRQVGRGFGTRHPCMRPAAAEDTMCNSHRSHANRAVAKEQAWQDRQQRSKESSQIAQDAVDALAKLDIKGQVNYEVPFGSGLGKYDGRVKIHAEDLMALLREVEEFREMKDLL